MVNFNEPFGPDYIVYRLTGNTTTDYCEASTSSLYDIYLRQWSEDMRRIIGLSEDAYPEIKGSGVTAGILEPSLAKKWKLTNAVQVIVGTGDNPAAAVACGCITEESVVLSIGTSGVLVFPQKEIDFNKKGKNIEFSIDGNDTFFLVQGVLQSAGNSRNWWTKNIIQHEFDFAAAEFDTKLLGSGELLFYPHLMGDKTIYNDMSLRGAFIGLSVDTNRLDMEIAVMEGICLGVRELVEAMRLPPEKINSLKVTGGGAKSKIWMQILADVLNVKVEQLSRNTGAAYGIALLAAMGCSDKRVKLSFAMKKNEAGTMFYPRRENVELYVKKYEKYKRIHDALKKIF